ncbi:MAG: radical SAM protein [Thermodesulfobacteriota bacterium]
MSARPDIVLVKPGSQRALYGELSAFDLTAIEPPLWGALLAGFLRDKGYSVILLDAEVEGWSYEETAEKINDANPVLAAVLVSGTNPSASTMNMTGAGKIITSIRALSPDIKTLLFGLHPSALPERTMEEETDVDFVCQGEGIYTLPPLIEALKTKEEKLDDIKGLWRREDGRVLFSENAPLLEDLDELPRPAWDLLPMDRYRAHNWHCFGDIDNRSPYGVLYTNLGCPFKCSFCCINALFGKNMIRYRGIDAVMDEIDFLVTQYGIKHIKIIDEMFALNEERVIKLCDRIISRKYDLNFWAYARVDTVSEPMLAKMKEAGINWLAYGFESGSKKVLKDATKGYKLDRLAEVVEMNKKLDINICSNFIFGLPEDDMESMEETLKLMIEINGEWANIYSAMAYPGSKLFDEAIKFGWPLPESWQAYSQYSYDSLPLPTKHLTSGQVLAFSDHAFIEYYKNPAYLKMIEKKFGSDTLRHIKEMSSKRLKRKNT